MMPTPGVAAVAVMALLAFGVLVGSAISPLAPSAAKALLLAFAPKAKRIVKAPPVLETPTPPAAAQVAAPVAPPATVKVPKSTPKPPQPAAGKRGGEGAGSAPVSATGLPPIRHVFLIVLSNQGATATFGPSSPAPYLSKTLPHAGELLENYYAVTGGELANEIALISGQGPTPETAANCPLYTDLTPGTIGAEGQALGSGCVYPRQTLTLADQLTDAGRTWKAYVEDVEAGGPGQPTSCRHPTLGAADADTAPAPGDGYVTWRNPFVYFHSLIDGTECAQDDVGLTQLAKDLKSAKQTPSFAYIVPDRCDDGSETPCAAGQPAGLTAAETFLRKVVPQIEASPAYKEGGLIAITADQAPQTGPGADASGCCTTTPYPNLPSTGAGTTSTSTQAPPTPTASAPPTSSTPTDGATTGVTTTSATQTTTTVTGTQTASPAGGGRVGLLLISKYVKPGTLNVTGEYNHFALLGSIEKLFGLQPLGYAGATGLLTFDASVFNAAS